MQDRPNHDELLAAVERFLDDEIVAKGEGAQRFHGRVAANVIRIVRRELEHEEAHLASEWKSLDALLGAAPRPKGRDALQLVLQQRNEELSERIRSADMDGAADDGDDFREAVLTHVRLVVRDKLTVTNPSWIEG
jgi:hypothetical protein